MKTKLRAFGIVATAALLAGALAGCGNDENGAGGGLVLDGGCDVPLIENPDNEPVTITWWHNGVDQPLLGFWEDVAQQFMDANDHVTVIVAAHQNEDLRNTILPNAFAGGTAPDVFQSWGGGELIRYFQAGQIADVSDFVPGPIADAASMFAINDGIWGMPYTSLPSGFWVNMNLWEEAGLTDADFPETLEDLFATWDTLGAAGITPVAVGGADGWPAAHWWYWTALRSLTPDALLAGIALHDFSDEGWVDAGELLQTIIDRSAFNPGWEATSAQQGAASASGMVVLGQAAMQLMGTWDFGVMGGIYNDAMGLDEYSQAHAEFLRWFPFPQAPGTAGDPAAIMGGVDGFSVRCGAPIEAAQLLEFIVSTPVQTEYARMGNIPIDGGASHAMPAGPLDDAAAAVAAASSVNLWLDTALGDGAFNGAIVAFMNGQGTPEDVVQALNDLFN